MVVVLMSDVVVIVVDGGADDTSDVDVVDCIDDNPWYR